MAAARRKTESNAEHLSNNADQPIRSQEAAEFD